MDLHRRSVLTGLAAASLCPICLARGAAAAGGHAPHWTYEGAEGPEHWGELSPQFKACSLGTQQSPIDLVRPIRAGLAPLDIRWRPFRGKVVNNGHTIEIPSPDAASEGEAESESFEDLTDQAVPNQAAADGTIREQGGEVFQLKQFHFHHPSEHHLDGKGLAMEIHFVHLNEKRDAALVLGVLIVAGAENPVLKTIWASLPETQGEVALTRAIHPAGLLPANRERFRYEGSLTTPPCTEIIHWNIFRHPITASKAQIETFARLFPNDARPLTPLNRRFLLEG